MRKYVTLILVLVFTLSLVGCNTDTVTDKAIDSVSTADSDISPTENLSFETTKEAPSSYALPDGAIRNDEAIEIALNKANLTKDDVIGLHCELDYDNIVLKYEVKFSDGKYDYDCEINAESGKVLHFKKELDN